MKLKSKPCAELPRFADSGSCGKWESAFVTPQTLFMFGVKAQKYMFDGHTRFLPCNDLFSNNRDLIRSCNPDQSHYVRKRCIHTAETLIWNVEIDWESPCSQLSILTVENQSRDLLDRATADFPHLSLCTLTREASCLWTISSYLVFLSVFGRRIASMEWHISS